MKYLEQAEINEIAIKFITLRDQANTSSTTKKEYLSYQNYCVEKLRFLVVNKANRYRQFSNHPDLEQDGLEALILALKTYNPNKGCFSWWADKYINTRISRAANNHSTIRFPLKKARLGLKPYKTNSMPVMIDEAISVDKILEITEQNEMIQKAIKQLSQEQQNVVCMVYGFNGIKQYSINSLVKHLSISRSQCVKILEEAKNQLKSILIK